MPNLRVPQNWQSPSTASSLIDFFGQTSIESICTCAYMVSSIGSIVVGVTDWTDDLTGVPGYPGVTFKHTTGISASKLEHPQGVEPANIEVEVFISAAGLDEDDIQAGKWDHGSCRILTTNALALHMGQLIEVDGYFSEFIKIGRIYRTELRGKLEAFRQVIGKVTEPLCDAVHGDTRCGRDLVALGEVHSTTITNVTSQKVFRATGLTQGAGYFNNAKGSFTTGNNSGFPFRVDTWDHVNDEITLRTDAPYLPQVGDGITVERGCELRISDCITRSNAINFRGFEDIPTVEEFTKLPVV